MVVVLVVFVVVISRESYCNRQAAGSDRQVEEKSRSVERRRIKMKDGGR